MFEPEIFGLSGSTLTGFMQALITPTLGFLFLYLMRLPLPRLFFVPDKVEYTPPKWVLPIFAHGSAMAIAATASAVLFLKVLREDDFKASVEPELFLTRELDAQGKPLKDVTFTLAHYDGFSDFRVLVNGYQLFGTMRDCVTSFQCRTHDDAEATRDFADFRKLRVSGGSVYDLDRQNVLGEAITLRHHLAEGTNHIDLISENAGTGGCGAVAQVSLLPQSGGAQQHLVRILPHRGAAPARAGKLATEEDFHASGTSSDVPTIERYNTPSAERRNSVCERIRITLKLSQTQAQALSSDTDFERHFTTLQASYVCATIGKPMDRCGVWP